MATSYSGVVRVVVVDRNVVVVEGLVVVVVKVGLAVEVLVVVGPRGMVVEVVVRVVVMTNYMTKVKQTMVMCHILEYLLF